MVIAQVKSQWCNSCRMDNRPGSDWKGAVPSSQMHDVSLSAIRQDLYRLLRVIYVIQADRNGVSAVKVLLRDRAWLGSSRSAPI